MTMKSRLEDDLKTAMRSKDVLKRGVIRYVRSEIHNKEIAKKSELDDAGILQVLTAQAQQRRDSIQAYGDANREDLVEQERAELEIIMEYLPKQLSTDEIAELVNRVVQEVGAEGPSDMKKVMPKLMPHVRGKSDGQQVSKMVMEVLKGLAG
jgi:uncharacterized protein YqeY